MWLSHYLAICVFWRGSLLEKISLCLLYSRLPFTHIGWGSFTPTCANHQLLSNRPPEQCQVQEYGPSYGLNPQSSSWRDSEICPQCFGEYLPRRPCVCISQNLALQNQHGPKALRHLLCPCCLYFLHTGHVKRSWSELWWFKTKLKARRRAWNLYCFLKKNLRPEMISKRSIPLAKDKMRNCCRI